MKNQDNGALIFLSFSDQPNPLRNIANTKKSKNIMVKIHPDLVKALYINLVRIFG